MDHKCSVSSLPPDVLRELFISCLPTKPSFRSKDAPMVPTHVCKTWRDVALSSNVLWSHIVVPKFMEVPKGIIKLVALWLDRAGGFPLDVKICIFQKEDNYGGGPESDDESDGYSSSSTEDFDGDTKMQFEAILDLLAPYRAQFRSFKGYFPDEYMTRLGVSSMQNAEEISYLMLNTHFEDSGESDAEINLSVKVLDIGPAKDKLERLTVLGSPVNYKSVMAQEHLTYLKLGHKLCAEVAVLLLKSLPKLKTVELRLLPFDPEHQDDQTKELFADFKKITGRVDMSNLESLIVHAKIRDASPGTLLDRICAPNLQELTLESTDHHSVTFCWDALQEFTKASGSRLRSLNLKTCNDAPAHLLNTLALFPKLNHLSIESAVLSDDIFRGLTCTDPAWQGHLLPELQSLRLCECKGFSSRVLEQFLTSRTNSAPADFSKLKDVCIKHCSNVQYHDKRRLMACGVNKIEIITQLAPYYNVPAPRGWGNGY